MRRITPALVALAIVAGLAADEPTPPAAAEPAADAPAQPPAPVVPATAPVGFIRPGETIGLRMSYGILGTAGTTTIETFAEQSPAGPCYRIHVTTHSSGLIDTVYPIVNDSESVLDAATGRPLTLKTKGKNGRRLTEKTTTFDYEKGQAVHVNIVRPKYNTTVPLPPDPAYDLMVAMLQAREWRLKPGESRRVQCVNDEEFFTIEVTALAEETIKTPLGTFDTVQLEPKLAVGTTSFFAKGGAMKIWISKGDRPQIIRLDTKTKFGTIVAVLTKDETKPPAPPAGATPPPTLTAPAASPESPAPEKTRETP